MTHIQIELIKELLLTVIVLIAGGYLVYQLISFTEKQSTHKLVKAIYCMFCLYMVFRLFSIIILAQYN